MPSKRASFWLTAAGLYAGALAAVYRTALPGGGSCVLAGDRVGAVFVWEFWQRARSSAAFTDALMFPKGVPLLPHSPLVLWAGTFLSARFDPYAAQNALHLLAYLAAGLSMFALARELTGDDRSSLVAGFTFMFSHYALTQHSIGHLGESAAFFLPVAALGFLRMLSASSRSAALLFAAGCVGTCLSTPYLAFAWTAVGLPSLVLLHRSRFRARLRDREFRLAFGGSILAGAAAGAAAYRPLFVLGSGLIGGSESYALSLLSFLDAPSWHASAWVQALRMPVSRSGPAPTAENMMGYFGCSTAVLLAVGLRRGGRTWVPWAGLLGISALLSLGPTLHAGWSDTGIPMPYALFRALPFVGLLREPARLIVLGSLAASALTALAFDGVSRRLGGERERWALAAAFAALYAWEMGLPAVGAACVPFESGGAYAALARDPAPGAVLELPAAIFGPGDVTINVQEYMLYQPLHGRPLVLGRPPRHARESLEFCETTPIVYELTHPGVLSALYSAPGLRKRLESLKRDGRETLARGGIRYVLFHSRDRFFPDAEKEGTLRLLADALGAPAMTDERGRMLFRTY